MVATHVLLPFYAIGSALVLGRLLDGDHRVRGLAIAWLVAAPLWSFYFMFSHPRSLLDRDDVAKTSTYLAAHDHNDFVLSNLLSERPIQLAFQRHLWPTLDADNTDVPRDMPCIANAWPSVATAVAGPPPSTVAPVAAGAHVGARFSEGSLSHR